LIFDEGSDDCKYLKGCEKITNYVGIFRFIMWKNAFFYCLPWF